MLGVTVILLGQEAVKLAAGIPQTQQGKQRPVRGVQRPQTATSRSDRDWMMLLLDRSQKERLR
jgi:hypothetical protein